MNYKQIQQFLTIVKYMNLSTAAKELFISQPALSLSLARMEATLNVQLFYRDGNRLILSATGEKLLATFQKLNDDFERLYAEATEIKAVQDQVITIGFSCSAMLYSVMYLSDLLASHNGKIIKKVHANSEHILALLKSNGIDFAITTPPLEDEAISNATIMTEPIFLVVSSSHPLAARKTVRFKDLRNADFVGLSKHHKFRQDCDCLCNANNFAPNYTIECEYPEQRQIIKESAGSKRYISFCARDSFEQYYGAGYTMITIEAENMYRSTAISWLTENKLQYQYKDLIDHIINNFSAMYSEHIRLISTYNPAFDSTE